MNCKVREDGQRGAILLLLLVMIVVLGLSAGMAGRTWRSTMQKEREAELIWRGKQIQQAIGSYYQLNRGFPAKLEDLVKDPRAAGLVRHLRKLYNDPMTGGDWVLIKDESKRLKGVRSKSELVPFRMFGFPEALKKLEGKISYNQWEFVYAPAKRKQRTETNPAATAPKGLEE